MSRRIKNRQDVRYIKVQEKFDSIVAKYFRCGHIVRLRIPTLSREANVWKSTFYDHFKNLEDAIFHFQHKYDFSIRRLRKEIESEKNNLEISYTKILFFIYQHKSYYYAILSRNNPIPVLTIVKTFRPVVTKSWSLYSRENLEFCFQIFSGEVYGVISFWGISEHFDKNKISAHAKYLVRLSQNSTKRLS